MQLQKRKATRKITRDLFKNTIGIRYSSINKIVEALDDHGNITILMQLPAKEITFKEWEMIGSHRLYVYRKCFG